VTDVQHDLYCPSCAAKLPANVLSSADPECPVCGTKLTGVDAPVSKQSAATETVPERRLTTEELLLERLKQDEAQPAPKKLPMTFFVILIAVIAVAAYSIYSATKKPEQFAKPKASDELTLEQRAMIQHATDSLTALINREQQNAEAHLSLANVYYDAKDWAHAAPHYQAYLDSRPDDPGPRVDYAFVLSQTKPNDLTVALAQIDTALKYKPDYLSALYNGGILAVQMTGTDHMAGLTRAREYFQRAKTVADTAAPAMAKQIDTLIMEIDRTGERMGKKPAK
jgi:Tfp pilus assembly protein PilF